MPPPEFDAEKFRELALYIVAKCVDDPTFGATKLAKILCWSDFLMYGYHGRAITGATYLRYPFGPYPEQLPQAEDELIGSGDAEPYEAPYFTRVQRRLRAKRRANLSIFGGEEIALVDEVIQALSGLNASEVSELSHQQLVGWQLATPFEEIPYPTVTLSSDPPSARDISWARQVASEQGFAESA